MDEVVTIWIDGSCGRRGGWAGWGAVAQWPGGGLVQDSGLVARGAGATEAEIMACYHALDLVPDDLAVVVRTDCRSLADALEQRIPGIDTPAWEVLLERVERRSAPVHGSWQRRKASRGGIAAHHLANSARLLAEMDQEMARARPLSRLRLAASAA